MVDWQVSRKPTEDPINAVNPSLVNARAKLYVVSGVSGRIVDSVGLEITKALCATSYKVNN